MLRHPLNDTNRLLQRRKSRMRFLCSLYCSAGLLAVMLPVGAAAEKNEPERRAEEASASTPLASQASSADVLSAEEVLDLPKAENVDLKEVVPEPLNSALPTPSAETPVKESEVTETSPSSKVVESSVSSTSASSVSANDEADPEQDRTSAPEPETPSPEEDEGAKPLRLLGTKVEPGTTTRLAWSPKESLAGISTPTPVLVAHGAESGAVVCLTGAVHGDELNGIEIVRQVLYDLDPGKLTGTVIGVPIVNLQGFRRASRYLPDRRDLNRYFPGNPDGSSASRIAHSFFSDVVQHCDYLIDLHTGSFRRTNLPQLRADLNNPEVAKMTENMGAIVVLQSDGAEGTLRRAAVDAGVTAVTVEAGEPLHVDFDAVKQGVSSVETFLDQIGVYDKSGLWARKTKPVYVKSLWVRADSGGILFSEVNLGERVSEGQRLGKVTDPITNAVTPIESPIDGQVIGMALNQIMLPGYAAYHIGFQATVEEAATEDTDSEDAAEDELPDEASE